MAWRNRRPWHSVTRIAHHRHHRAHQLVAASANMAAHIMTNIIVQHNATAASATVTYQAICARCATRASRACALKRHHSRARSTRAIFSLPLMRHTRLRQRITRRYQYSVATTRLARLTRHRLYRAAHNAPRQRNSLSRALIKPRHSLRARCRARHSSRDQSSPRRATCNRVKILACCVA